MHVNLKIDGKQPQNQQQQIFNYIILDFFNLIISIIENYAIYYEVSSKISEYKNKKMSKPLWN
jgi:hypothetical protein